MTEGPPTGAVSFLFTRSRSGRPVAADPSSPDTVTRAEDLARLVENTPDVEAHTPAGANHLIHDAKDRREAFWSIVDDFLARV